MTDAILSARPLYRGWLSLIAVRLRLNGMECERPLVEHVSGATVLAYDPERRVAMTVRQTRDAVLYLDQPRFAEAVAGVTEGEDPVDTARREAWEEAGLRLGVLEPVATVWMTPSSTTERVSLFLAAYTAADRTGAGGGAAGENEVVETREESLADLWAAIERGEMTDAKLLMCLQALRIRRPELFG